MEAGIVRPGVLLRIEGATLLAASLFLYGQSEGSWLLFVLLILAPDLSMAGYIGGNALGAMVYNLFHSYPLPVALAAYGWFANNPLALQLAFIWLAHIGGDRLVGYGLKYSTGFKDTHLSRV
jgi:hypothetical protein